MKTHRIDVTRWTAGSPEATFAALADESSWPDWSPMDSGELERPGPADPHGVGAIRRFRTGRSVSRERVVALDPPGPDAPGALGYELLSGLPIRDYRARVELTPRDGGTEIRWRSTFHAKVPFTGWIYRLALGRFIGQVADGLAAHVGVTTKDDAPTAPR
jgi:hypothetical protein